MGKYPTYSSEMKMSMVMAIAEQSPRATVMTMLSWRTSSEDSRRRCSMVMNMNSMTMIPSKQHWKNTYSGGTKKRIQAKLNWLAPHEVLTNWNANVVR